MFSKFWAFRLRILHWLVCGLTTLVAVPVNADEAEDVVDNIVVTGTRTSNVLSEIPNTTTVIDLTEIEARNDLSVADLLRKVPGIHVTQPSGQGGVARIFVRLFFNNLISVKIPMLSSVSFC